MKKDCTVLLITYNHIDNIGKCIESVLAQKTKYSYIIRIFDDASNDGTSDIIKEFSEKYPDKIEIHIASNNRGAEENIWKAYNSVDTKYFMCIEGDDLLCCDKKIQLQIDALEKYPQCSFASGLTKMLGTSDSFRERESGMTIPYNEMVVSSKGLVGICDILHQPTGSGYISHISSRMIRTQCLNLSKIKFKSAVLHDNSQFYYLLLQGPMFFINEIVSIYRMTGKGICSSKEPFIRARDTISWYMNFNEQTNYVIGDRIYEEMVNFILYSISQYKGFISEHREMLSLLRPPRR